jgi:hypothetical protein
MTKLGGFCGANACWICVLDSRDIAYLPQLYSSHQFLNAIISATENRRPARMSLLGR